MTAHGSPHKVEEQGSHCMGLIYRKSDRCPFDAIAYPLSVCWGIARTKWALWRAIMGKWCCKKNVIKISFFSMGNAYWVLCLQGGATQQNRTPNYPPPPCCWPIVLRRSTKFNLCINWVQIDFCALPQAGTCICTYRKHKPEFVLSGRTFFVSRRLLI